MRKWERKELMRGGRWHSSLPAPSEYSEWGALDGPMGQGPDAMDNH